MNLQILGSSSAGNCYLFNSERETLVVECGLRFPLIKQALNFDLSRVAGCIVTHEHKDHSKGVDGAIEAGIDIYATSGTHVAMGTEKGHRSKIVQAGKQYQVGEFRIMSFDVKHDAAEPVGYLIHHQECGTVLFLTDSYYTEYTFRGLNNILVEANYCERLIDRLVSEGKLEDFRRRRLLTSHMSIQTCRDMLAANDLSAVNNIVLIHLSDGNSEADRFKREVEQETGKTVHIADAGLIIENFDKTPF